MIHRGWGELDRAVTELEQVVEHRGVRRQVWMADLASDTAMLERVRQEQARLDPGPTDLSAR